MPKSGDYVYRRKNGSWEARYVKEISPDGKKKYGSVYAKTCKEAKKAASQTGILPYESSPSRMRQ